MVGFRRDSVGNRQDFSAFSEEAFNPKAWVNGALAAPRGQGISFDVGDSLHTNSFPDPHIDDCDEAAELHSGERVSIIDDFILTGQKINEELEETSSQVMADLPRCNVHAGLLMQALHGA
jgi:hypothetical protein